MYANDWRRWHSFGLLTRLFQRELVVFTASR